MLKEKPSDFKAVCPRQLDGPPCSACPLAMERLNAIKAEGPADKRKRDLESLPGCPWYIASSEYNYCFWNLAKELQDDPRSDREICDLLMISQATLDRTFDAAIEKFKNAKDGEALKSLQEAVVAATEGKHMDYTMYMPDEFRDIIKDTGIVGSTEDVTPEPKPKPAKKHSTGLPMHRDGKKVDLFGLYSRKSMEKKSEKDRKNDKKSEKDEKNDKE